MHCCLVVFRGYNYMLIRAKVAKRGRTSGDAKAQFAVALSAGHSVLWTVLF